MERSLAHIRREVLALLPTRRNLAGTHDTHDTHDSLEDVLDTLVGKAEEEGQNPATVVSLWVVKRMLVLGRERSWGESFLDLLHLIDTAKTRHLLCANDFLHSLIPDPAATTSPDEMVVRMEVLCRFRPIPITVRAWVDAVAATSVDTAPVMAVALRFMLEDVESSVGSLTMIRTLIQLSGSSPSGEEEEEEEEEEDSRSCILARRVLSLLLTGHQRDFDATWQHVWRRILPLCKEGDLPQTVVHPFLCRIVAETLQHETSVFAQQGREVIVSHLNVEVSEEGTSLDGITREIVSLVAPTLLVDAIVRSLRGRGHEKISWPFLLSLAREGCKQNPEFGASLDANVEELVREALSSSDESVFLACLVIARHASVQPPSDVPRRFPSYEAWFQRNLISVLESVRAKHAISFVQRSLSSLVPFEAPFALQTHFRTISQDVRLRQAFSEYATLVKTRLLDLGEEDPTVGVERVDPQVEIDVYVQEFACTAAIPDALHVAKLFKRKWYKELFLPALLTPAPLNHGKTRARCCMIDLIAQRGMGISVSAAEEYRAACEKQSEPSTLPVASAESSQERLCTLIASFFEAIRAESPSPHSQQAHILLKNLSKCHSGAKEPDTVVECLLNSFSDVLCESLRSTGGDKDHSVLLSQIQTAPLPWMKRFANVLVTDTSLGRAVARRLIYLACERAHLLDSCQLAVLCVLVACLGGERMENGQTLGDSIAQRLSLSSHENLAASICLSVSIVRVACALFDRVQLEEADDSKDGTVGFVSRRMLHLLVWIHDRHKLACISWEGLTHPPNDAVGTALVMLEDLCNNAQLKPLVDRARARNYYRNWIEMEQRLPDSHDFVSSVCRLEFVRRVFWSGFLHEECDGSVTKACECILDALLNAGDTTPGDAWTLRTFLLEILMTLHETRGVSASWLIEYGHRRLRQTNTIDSCLMRFFSLLWAFPEAAVPLGRDEESWKGLCRFVGVFLEERTPWPICVTGVLLRAVLTCPSHMIQARLEELRILKVECVQRWSSFVESWLRSTYDEDIRSQITHCLGPVCEMMADMLEGSWYHHPEKMATCLRSLEDPALVSQSIFRTLLETDCDKSPPSQVLLSRIFHLLHELVSQHAGDMVLCAEEDQGPVLEFLCALLEAAVQWRIKRPPPPGELGESVEALALAIISACPTTFCVFAKIDKSDVFSPQAARILFRLVLRLRRDVVTRVQTACTPLWIRLLVRAYPPLVHDDPGNVPELLYMHPKFRAAAFALVGTNLQATPPSVWISIDQADVRRLRETNPEFDRLIELKGV